ncbi:hypothetical protein NIES2100_66120 [Calothrix sp. NIES-2100]|uniref:hypothetical protein n=1 Tax=Calothrix sp. NIES-2100 TaxID=1954172 RepID=UPI000B5E3D68|nr:hypothetical protein NIES2100_66120 [Calothrix sp. NIES-2100]
MREMSFKPLTEEDRQKNQYLDKINHAPYPTIVLIAMAMFVLFTIGILMGAF